MADFISDFITDIVNAGIMPKSTRDIVGSERFKRVAVQDDKGGKRSMSYWLRLEHDFAYGYAKDFKTGIEHKFHSYNKDKNLSRADVARIKALLKARQAAADLETAERHAKIALRAQFKWERAQTNGHSLYEDRKAIKATTARYEGQNIIIPLYDPKDWSIVSWQTIKPDGTKRFPFGGKKKGCCHIIGQIDPTKPIVLVEGYATGKTIHDATGMTVAVCFDAGNILSVAKVLRSIYKNTPFIVGGDNDKSGAGQKAAQDAIKAVPNCTAIISPVVGNDFNDIGLEATKLAFNSGEGDSSQGSKPQGQSLATTNYDWMGQLIVDAKNNVVSSSLRNTIMYLNNHDDYKGVFAYDEFRQSIVVKRCPVWTDLDGFNVVPLNDATITHTASDLERHGLTCAIDRAAKAIQVVALENKFHSAREYISALQWDGVPRLEGYLSSLGCTKESAPYLSFVFKKWMTAAVKRLMEPGCKFDHVLILESQQQGLYKSQFLKALSTFNGECYHTDAISVSHIGGQYTALKMQGVMFVELAELSGFNKQEDEEIKNWITQTVDEVRLPYERTVSKYQRQFVFSATTNNYGYLKDPTGGRRFWPVTIEKVIDIDEVNSIKEQLWAEAKELYKNGLYIGPTPEENEWADLERSKRMSSDAWEDDVMRIVISLGLDEFKSSHVLDKMQLRASEKNDNALKRIGKILQQNGYVNDPRWDKQAKKNVRLWSK